MTRYAGNAAAIRGLVRDQEVHRDVYVSEEVFQLEMEHLFPNSWVYVGHDSQVPNPGDYYGTTIDDETPAGVLSGIVSRGECVCEAVTVASSPPTPSVTVRE